MHKQGFDLDVFFRFVFRLIHDTGFRYSFQLVFNWEDKILHFARLRFDAYGFWFCFWFSFCILIQLWFRFECSYFIYFCIRLQLYFRFFIR